MTDEKARLVRPRTLVWFGGAAALLAILVAIRAPSWGEEVGLKLHRVVQTVVPTPPRRAADELPYSGDGQKPFVVRLPPSTEGDGGSAHAAHGPPGDAGGDARALRPLLAVRVPAEVVRRIALSGRVAGVPAVDETGKPLGVRLTGVAGSGLRDGDVVTHIEGAPVFTPNQAVSVIVGALANGRTTVSGTVLRDGQTFSVTAVVPQEHGPTSPDGSAPPPAPTN